MQTEVENTIIQFFCLLVKNADTEILENKAIKFTYQRKKSYLPVYTGCFFRLP